ncbi:MAG: hypothetical protein ACSLFL_01585 [Alphaproteobacteria bacterium]
MPPYLFISIAAGLLSAVLYGAAASGSMLSIIPIYLSPLPLFLAGLGYGGTAALIGGISATGAIALAGGPLLGVAYFLVNAAAPIIVTRAANWSRQVTAENGSSSIEYYPAGMLFAWLSGLGIVIMVLLALFMQRYEGGLSGWIPQIIQVEALSQTIMQAQLQTGSVPIDEEALRSRLIQFALPGLGLFWMLISIGNGALAQHLLVRLGRNARPTPDFVNMDLPQFMLWPLLGAAVLAFFSGDLGLIGAVVATLAAMPYFFLGLATVHVISHHLPGRAFALTGFYVLLLALGWPVLLIVGLGIVEHFANLRRTYAIAKP